MPAGPAPPAAAAGARLPPHNGTHPMAVLERRRTFDLAALFARSAPPALINPSAASAVGSVASLLSLQCEFT